jgi:hypothetical protein
MPADAIAAESVAAGLRAVRPEVIVAFGGAAAPDPGTAAAASAGTIRLLEEVGEAVAALSAALSRNAPASRGSRRAAGHTG